MINELPDLQARIQVALFNILQEGDIQIRGFKLRLPLDIQFVFTANPEDYTNRGSIVTPLKDRIGSQILTHYPHNLEIAKRITQQEAKINPENKAQVHVPELAKDLLEQIGFEARRSEYVDSKSGVSTRMSITAFENLISAAERRLLMTHDPATSIRMNDFVWIITAINGKIELVYEGEQESGRLMHGRVGRWTAMFETFTNENVFAQFFGYPTTLKYSFHYVGVGSHNDYVRMLFLSGYFGLFYYITLLVIFYNRAKKLRNATKYLAFGTLGILVLFSISIVPTYYPPFMYVVMCVFAYVALPKQMQT